jgi:DNA-binding LacI/PurR family transcriptional regulator
MKKKNITLQQVAELAQVAPITVSRVLNDSGYVSVEKRQRVLQAAQKLNYTLHAGAKELASRKGQARMIAVVLPQLDNPFFVRVLEGCQEVADELGYDVLIYNTRGYPASDERAVESLMRRRVEGLIYTIESGSDGLHEEALVDLFAKVPVPCVFVEHDLSGLQADIVMIDNAQAGYLATKHLIEQGYRRIALIASSPDLRQDRDRWQGYRRAIQEHDLTPSEYFIPHSQRKKIAGQQIVHTLLDSAAAPDAIFAASTLITIGVFQGLKERAIRMPEQMGLIGYGEVEWVSLLVPSLSVVSRPAEEVGQQAARLLFQRLEDEASPYRQVMLPATLLLRESSLRKKGHPNG